ncbi:MAG: hypothetical protein MJ005_06325 [Methanocorpusculum sp.]|nr:hypothetical protein [Methanocorpusculum sp.]HJJ45247.1 hypothetical protein [Methanocorpusculum sp.]
MKNVTKVVLAAVVVLLFAGVFAGTAAAGSGEIPGLDAAGSWFYNNTVLSDAYEAAAPGAPASNAPTAVGDDQLSFVTLSDPNKKAGFYKLSVINSVL